MLGRLKHKLESRLPGEISDTANGATLMTESEELKSLLMKTKESVIGRYKRTVFI